MSAETLLYLVAKCTYTVSWLWWCLAQGELRGPKKVGCLSGFGEAAPLLEVEATALEVAKLVVVVEMTAGVVTSLSVVEVRTESGTAASLDWLAAVGCQAGEVEVAGLLGAGTWGEEGAGLLGAGTWGAEVVLSCFDNTSWSSVKVEGSGMQHTSGIPVCLSLMPIGSSYPNDVSMLSLHACSIWLSNNLSPLSLTGEEVC